MLEFGCRQMWASRWWLRSTTAAIGHAVLNRHHVFPQKIHRNRSSYMRSFATRMGMDSKKDGVSKPVADLLVTFIDKDGKEHRVTASAGESLLEISQANNLDMEGACGGSCACSTCHAIVTELWQYNQMMEPSDDENDMLDLAVGLTGTSRLGCQVKMAEELNGLVVRLPSTTRDLLPREIES